MRANRRAGSARRLSQASEGERRAIEAGRLDAERRELREEVLDCVRCRQDRERRRTGDRGRRAASRAWTAVRSLAALVAIDCGVAGVRIAGLVVVVVVDAVVCMRVIFLATAVVMVPQRHALAGGNSSQALDRDGDYQEQDGKKSEKRARHRSEFYASSLERGSNAQFPRPSAAWS